MSSVVHFKFRNALLQDMVNFDGDHVSLADLKRLIAKKKGLIKAIDIDFAVSNQETGEGMNRLVHRDACTDGACGRTVELVRALMLSMGCSRVHRSGHVHSEKHTSHGA